jgi:hypothetical protein
MDKLRVFLERHAPVLRALRAWMFRIVMPPDPPKIGRRAKQVVEPTADAAPSRGD